MKSQVSQVLALTILLHIAGVWMVLPPVKYQIQEEQPAGTEIGNIVNDAGLQAKLGSDILEELQYRITNDDIADTIFSIDSNTGVLTTSSVLDREQLCAAMPVGITCTLNFDVAATRSNPDFYDVVAVTVDLLDVNDNTPSFPVAVYHLVIPESANPPVLYNLPLAKDADSPSFSVRKYSLETKSENFDLNVIQGGGTIRAVQLVLVKKVDRESLDSYQVSVMAEDGGVVPNVGVLRVNITVADANDHGPKFIQDNYVINISEDIPIMSTLVRVRALDEDTGMNGRIFYSLASASESLARQFMVDEATGDIVLRRPLDYETTASYHLIIVAQDGGVNSQQAYCDVTINISDVNDQAPVITINTLAGKSRAEVSEAAEPGQFVAHVSVKDLDTRAGGNFTCYSNNDQFLLHKLSEQRYDLVTGSFLDRETEETIQVSVVCSDKGSPSLTSSKDLTVVVQDENDNDPVFTQDTYRHEISENNRINEVILVVNATDKDLGKNAEVSYSIFHDPRELAKIDSKTGLIRASAVFDYEQEQEAMFVVQAKDGGSTPRSSTATVVLVIRDANDEPPRFTRNLYKFSLYENQFVGSEVGTVQSIDADSPPFDEIEYSLLQEQDLFTIDTMSGVIRAKAPLNREDSPMYALVVIATNANVIPPLSSTATVQVDVLDVNDNAPIVDFPGVYNRSVKISNQVPIGYQVCHVQAHDIDTGEHAKLHYAFLPGNDNAFFEIDRRSGVVVTKRSLSDYVMRTFQVTVSVSDNGFPPLESQSLLYIRVNKSVPYVGSQTLIAGTNMLIVITLAVISSIIVLILVIILVVYVLRDVRRKRHKALALRYNVENENDDVTMSAPGQPSNGSRNNDVPKKKQDGKGVWPPYPDKGSGGSEKDSDSAYSGDMSNSDSGRGPSLDSHDNKIPVPVMNIKPNTTRPNNFDPRHNYHPYYHREFNAFNGQNNIPQMISRNGHPCYDRPQKNKIPRRPPNVNYNNELPPNTNTNANPNTNSLNSSRSLDTQPEIDRASSTTSGSYVIDHDDVNKTYSVNV